MLGSVLEEPFNDELEPGSLYVVNALDDEGEVEDIELGLDCSKAGLATEAISNKILPIFMTARESMSKTVVLQVLLNFSRVL